MDDEKEIRCTGEKCPARLRCQRYDEHYLKPNGKVIRSCFEFKQGKFSCEMYVLKRK